MVLYHTQTQHHVTKLDQTAPYPYEPKSIINLYNQPVISSSTTVQNPNYIYFSESQLYILYRIPTIYTVQNPNYIYCTESQLYILYRIPTIYTVQNPNYIYCTESQLYILYRIPTIYTVQNPNYIYCTESQLYILYRIPTIYTVQRLARNLTMIICIQFQPDPVVIKLFSSSTQTSMKFRLLTKTKMLKIKTSFFQTGRCII